MTIALFAPLLVAALAGAALWLLWRRMESMRDEIGALRRQVEALENAGAMRRRANLHLAQNDEPPKRASAAKPPGARVLRFKRDTEPAARPALSDTRRGALLALAAAAPALGLFAGVDFALIGVIGVTVGALMMLLALSRSWSAAAWASVLTTAGWAIAALAVGGAQNAALLFSGALTCAAVAGLVQAFLARLAPGAALAAIAAAGALWLGLQTAMIGPPGAALAAIITLSAMAGALNLRLEAIHIGAFAAALIGLFALSGQDSAAIWFTPITAWAGALFFGVAVIRVPELGSRAVTLAGTGVLGPLGAIVALHMSRHALADGYAAAGALIVLAAALAWLIAAAAARGARTLASLKLTLWMLAGGAFSAFAAAMLLLGAPALAASAFMLAALGLILLNWRIAHALWLTLAWAAGGFALLTGAVAAVLFLSEQGSPWLQLGLGLAAPAALAALCAYLAGARAAQASAGFFEAIAIIFGVATASLTLRLLVSGGAIMLTPISFPEAGLHIALWLLFSLVLATNARSQSQKVRAAAATTLGALALAGSALITLLWLTPHWSMRSPNLDASPILQFAGLGFFAPALLFWAHWAFWRGRGSVMRTRLALGAGTLMMAAMATLVALQTSGGGPDWFGPMVGAAAFVLAIALNFAGGVTRANPATRRRSYFDENFQGNRRRQSRRQLR